jgi:hypothetical protein
LSKAIAGQVFPFWRYLFQLSAADGAELCLLVAFIGNAQFFKTADVKAFDIFFKGFIVCF